MEAVTLGKEGEEVVGRSWNIPGLGVVNDVSPPSSPEPISFLGPLYLNLVIKTKGELKRMINLYALRNNFQICVQRSCSKRYEIGCRGKECKLKIVGKRIGSTQCWQIRHFQVDHTCSYESTRYHTASTKTIGSVMAERLETNGIELKSKQIMDDVRKDYGIDCSYSKAWRAKEFAKSLVYGAPEYSFDTLKRYFYVLGVKNPGTQTSIELDEEHRFKCCYWAFGASIDGAKTIRPVFAIDGTHLKGAYKGVLFIAVGLDTKVSSWVRELQLEQEV